MSWWAILGILGSAVFFKIGLQVADDGTSEKVGVAMMVISTAVFVACLHWGIP